ncbi:protein BHLHb9 [Orycteropus afer afer]|uniref:Protein BHLHb9 n=1 Tax=Orycteropus afer afer TaxID=1230840 RepID=A0AC54ZGA1_ORYAF|nr:protein BHLHb9 [Orycteropus afer afer]
MSKNQAKTGKGAAVEAKAERKATLIASRKVKTQAEAGFEMDAVTQVKGVSKNKVAAEMKERGLSEPKALGKTMVKAMPRSWAKLGEERNTDFGPRAEHEATMMSCFSSVAEASATSTTAHEDETAVDAWFWAGEEASIGSWFWNGDEASDGSDAQYKDEGDVGAWSCVEEVGVEPVTGASCRPRAGAEEGEEEEEEEDGEDVIGKWFWDGDDTSFDPDPKPVYRIPKPRVGCQIDVNNLSNDPALIPALLAFATQIPIRTRPLSYIALSSDRKSSPSVPVTDIGLCEGTTISLESVQEHPFNSEICTQTIEAIRRQIKIRKMHGIKPFSCPCKMESCLDSEDFEKLVSLLESNTDPIIHKIAQIAMGIIKVHPFAQQFINDLGVLTVIDSLLGFESPDVTKKAEITLNPISEYERQCMVELHVVHMCKDTVSFPLNSPGQRSALKELGKLSVDSDYHYIVASYLTELFHILATGNRKTRNLLLKVLLNMSENPIAARDMIDIESLSVLKLIFNQKEAKANLVSAVAIFINIKEHIRKGSIIVINPLSYNELKAMFREVKMIIEKL